MRYLYTLLTIIMSWVMIIILLPAVQSSQHLILYILAVINTLVLFTIGFKKA